MLTISKPLSAGQAQSYHAKEFTAKEQNYWSERGVIAGEWQGRLASQFGLAGAVSAEDFAKLVIDDEIETQMKRALDGIEVTEDTLCLEAIERVGIGGSFLTSKAKDTFKHIQKETTELTVGDRNTREKWLASGGRSIGEKAREKVKEILETYEPEPLDGDIVKKLDEIIENAKRNLSKKQ